MIILERASSLLLYCTFRVSDGQVDLGDEFGDFFVFLGFFEVLFFAFEQEV